jgi:hypothetical protein
VTVVWGLFAWASAGPPDFQTAGYTYRVTERQFELAPWLTRERVEEMVKAEFVRKFGAEPDHMEWHREEINFDEFDDEGNRVDE